MDSFGLLPKSNVAIFPGFSVAAGGTWQTFRKPPGCKFLAFFVLAGGGNGGTGVVGAAGSAAGGGGGGSSGQTILTAPAVIFPDNIFLSIGVNVINSYVSAFPSNTANNVFAIANPGGNGGNASGSTGGTAGSAGAIATVATMPLGWMFANVLAGQAGAAGGGAVAGGVLTLPVTGLRVTGGTGGGGVPTVGAGANDGGGFSTPGGNFIFPVANGGFGPAVPTLPPYIGTSGLEISKASGYWYGGTGGGSTDPEATGAGLVQAAGGNGGYGCGGGGMGGALTGSTAAATSKGGPGLCIITWW